MRIKELREQHHVSQKELADKLGLNQSAISNYEKGISKPNIDIMLQIADFFNVSLDYLIKRKTKPYELGNLTVSQLELLDLIKNLSDKQILKATGYIQALNDEIAGKPLTIEQKRLISTIKNLTDLQIAQTTEFVSYLNNSKKEK